MGKVRIGNRDIGIGERVYVIAEIGSNHDGDLEQAKRHIDAAVSAGADAVKFQLFTADKLYSKYTPRFSYLEKSGHDEDTWEVIRKAEMPVEWVTSLMEHAKQHGVEFLCTPFDRESADLLDDLDVAAFKIASYEAVDLPFVQYVAAKGRPMIISTGMCNDQEIEDILSTCARGDNYQVALLQCTSLYPAPPHLTHLNVIRQWNQSGWITGLSDHTLGTYIPVAAVAVGAMIIEKHLTLSRRLPGPDHRHSLEPQEFSAMAQQIRATESAMGYHRKRGPAPEEIEMYRNARRSVVATSNIPAGTVITPEMVTSKRPGYGIQARDIQEVIGLTATRNIAADEVLEWSMISRYEV